jgi:Secretion system C-terminal sorting domain
VKKIKVLLILFLLMDLVNAQNHLVKQWDYRFGGNQEEDLGAFLQTADGGYLLAGRSCSIISGDKTQTTLGGSGFPFFDNWIIKIDSNGNKLWDKTFGGMSLDVLTLLQQTADGGFILGGYSFSGIGGDKTEPNRDTIYPFTPDYWIIKTDLLGNKQWDKSFGGDSTDYLSSLIQTADGGYLIGGYSYSGISGDKSQGNWNTQSTITPDYWIVKTDSLGNKQWDKTFGGTDGDVLKSLIQEPDNGYILGGNSFSGIGGDKTQNNWGVGPDYWIIKIDSLGNKQWDRNYGHTGSEDLTELKKTTDGGYILAGASSSWVGGDKSQPNRGFYDYWILKIDSLGNKQWDKTFGGTNEDFLHKIFLTQDGGYLFSGGSASNKSGDKTEDNISRTQTWVIKTDSLGNKEWDKTLRTGVGVAIINDDWPGLVIQTADGCFAMANSTEADIGGDKTQPCWGGGSCKGDYWIIKFCDTMQCYAATPVISSNYDTLFSTPAYSYQWYLNGVPLIGDTLQYFVIDSAGDYHYVAITDYNGCFAISSGVVGRNELQGNSNQIRVFPNPTTGVLNITIHKSNFNKAEFILMNILGEKIYYEKVDYINTSITKTISIDKLSSGIYFLQVFIDGEPIVKKIVKE